MVEDPAGFDAGSVFGTLELDHDIRLDRLVEFDLLQVDVAERAAHRVQLLLLDHDRARFAAVDREIEQRGALGDHVADVAFGHLEGGRLGAAGVDDAGDEPLAAHAASVAGTEVGARGDVQSGACIGHRVGQDRESARKAVCAKLWGMPDEAKIPKGRFRRSAKLGSIIGAQGARYAGPRPPTSPAPRRRARSGSKSGTSKRR